MIARLLALLLLALPLAACGQATPTTPLGAAPGDGSSAAPGSGTPQDEETQPSADADATADDAAQSAAELMATTSRCSDPSVGYEVAYPTNWVTNDGEVMPTCRLFDPATTEVEPGTEVPFDIAVSLRTSRQPLPAFIDADDAASLVTADAGTVDGHDVAVMEKRSNGAALLPDGMRFTQHVVDLGEMRLVATTFDTGERYQLHREVLAAMVDSLELDAEGAASPSDGPSDDASTSQRVALPDRRDVCSLEHPGEERIRLAYPEGWQVEDGDCRWFDPAMDEVPADTEPDVALHVRVDEVAFQDAVAAGPATRDEVTYVGAVAGRPLARVRAVATGEAGRPEGTPVLRYLVDLGGGEPRTLVASAHASHGASFELAARALDSTMQTLLVTPATTEAGVVVVTRRATGPAPYTVTYDYECFRLHRGGPDEAAVDEACDVALGDTALDAVLLEAGDLEVAAGLASPLAAFVVSDAASAPYGAVTASLEGGSAFAHEVVHLPTELRAIDLNHEVLGTAAL